MKEFVIRPRLTLGKERQMTFLSGSRFSIERSYRRSCGITEEDEYRHMHAILATSYGIQKAMGVHEGRYPFQFGASFREWVYMVLGENGKFCSREWLLNHDKSY